MKLCVKTIIYIFFISILFAGCSSEKECREAVGIYKRNDPEEYGRAINILERVPPKFYYVNDLIEINNPAYGKSRELLKKIEDEFTEIRRKYLFDYYGKTRIAFAKRDHSGINIFSPDGKTVKTITFNGEIKKLKWSPDGKGLLFAGHKYGSGQDAKDDIFILDLLKERIIQATHTAGEEIDPSWSSDSSKIIFVRAESGYDEIVVSDLPDLREHVLYPRKQRTINPEVSNPLILPGNKDIAASFGLYFYMLREKEAEPGPAYELFQKTARNKEWIEKLFIGEASFSYDYNKLIYTYYNSYNDMEILDLKTGSVNKLTGGCINGLAPDNEYQLFVLMTGEKSVIYARKAYSEYFEPDIELFEGSDPVWSPWLSDKILKELN